MSEKAKDKRKYMLTILSISIIAVLLVPMLYSSIYLGSVWDVYGKIDQVPVAFVNMDKTVIKDGKEYAVGKELEDNLKDNDKVAWKFVSHQQAMKGVQGTEYYAVIEVPEDFSQNIADTQEGNFKTPEITYISNKSKNFVFTQVSAKVAESLKSEVGSNIQKELSKALVNSLYDVKVSIKDASDGAKDLQDGTQKLLDGSKVLGSGVQSTASGSLQLESGLKTAADSSAKLQEGTQELLNGSSDLSSGIKAALDASKQLQDGLKSLAAGQSQVVDGSASLLNGLNTMKSGLTKPNDQIPELVKGASNLNAKAGTIAEGAEQLDISMTALADAINSADAYLHNENLNETAKLNAVMSILDKVSQQAAGPNGESQITLASNSVHQLSLGLKQLKTGTHQVSDGVSTLATGLTSTQTTAAAGLDQLINGAKGLQNGNSSVLAGLNTAASRTGDLVNGLDQLNSGSTSLNKGLKAVNDGNTRLKDGLYSAAAKTGELSSGLKVLNSGAATLNNGLQDANNGARKLKDGLNNGYTDMSDKLKFNSENMSQFISEPVTVKDSSINDVKHYGEGLAPYFVSLSLWLGAMFMSAIFSIAKSQKVFKSKNMNSFIGRFAAGAALVSLQAVILSFTLIKALGANPVSLTEFYANNIFIAITFFSVMYGVSNVIGIMSAPVMFIVLLLQLASSGGTFPIETAPAFYRVVNKVIPMTYSVSNLRMTLSGINYSVFNHNNLILMSFILIFMVGGAALRGLINLSTSQRHTTNASEII
jgi:putative membrane protein